MHNNLCYVCYVKIQCQGFVYKNIWKFAMYNLFKLNIIKENVDCFFSVSHYIKSLSWTNWCYFSFKNTQFRFIISRYCYRLELVCNSFTPFTIFISISTWTHFLNYTRFDSLPENMHWFTSSCISWAEAS